ncbi:MAG: efflux RND transporter permease subunit [Alphaproteobacteria bacterium]|nr:efflux RND transporter permease subunit [Alphaproteobacteria bacterium]
MNLYEICIKRPVFATVISLLIVAFGVLSFERLPLRELPDIDPPVVSVQTNYPGASSSVVETRVTQPLEDSVAGIEGIDTISSSSRDGASSITITFRLTRDIEAAANDVRNAVSRALANLPDEVDPPEVQKAEADGAPIMFLNLTSTAMSRMELTDYADRYIVDRLSTVDGVARVGSFGEQRALRIWLDRVALAARGLTVADVENALRAENIELPAGRLESNERNLTIRVERGYLTEQDFRNLVIKRGEDAHLTRLGEVARVEIGPRERRTTFRGNGQPQVGIAIFKQSTSNQLAVARGVRAEAESIKANLPPGMSLVVAVDYSVFIEESVNEVYITIAITGALVLLVIFLFLGNVRAAIVPSVTVPVCLLGSLILLAAFGASINLLTLLALVLAIGLVVDDAIVVLENVQRRVDLGEPPLIAAVRGTRQVAFAVLATTAVLIAVFVPIIFLEGTIGRLFSELGVALGAAVAISALVALSLSPMMCSQLLRPVGKEGFLSRVIQGSTQSLARLYRAVLEASLDMPVLVIMMFAGVIVAAAVLFRLVPGEIAPTEDRGIFDISISMPEGTGYDSALVQMLAIEKALLPLVKDGSATRVIVRVPGSFGPSSDFNSGRGIVVLGPWGTRPPQAEVIERVTQALRKFPNVRGNAIPRSSFGRGGGGNSPVQFVLGGSSFEELIQWRDKIMARAEQFPGLVNVDSDYKETKPQLNVRIDPTRAADLGVTVSTVGRTLETMLGQRRVGTFVDRGEEYDIIVQGLQENRRQPSDMTNILVRSQRTGALIPLSNLVSSNESATASSLNRFNRLRAITISANLAPGTTLGQALDFLERAAREELPATAQIDYRGQSLEYKESSSTLAFTFGLALLVVFLVLAAQFESFVHPLIIILTVPLAVAGALFGLWASGATLNIYSQIGIVMLVGLAAKNGILIVEFANQLRDEGRSVRDALVEASITRFRPILMTSLSTAIGAVPLIVYEGAGAQSRFAIGIVVFAGVIFSTALTLFIVPTFYNLLARFTRSPGAIAAEIAAWERENPGVSAGETHAAGATLRERFLSLARRKAGR